ncbi:MFS_OAT domain containing protein [Rhabdaerophilaceae bacterium]
MREPEPSPQDKNPAETAHSGDVGDLRARLDALKANLGDTIAREDAEKKGKAGSAGNASALGDGMRAASELVAGILVGTGIGFMLDRYFGTKPLFLLILMIAGMAAGFRNIYRLGMRPTVLAPRVTEPEGSRKSDPSDGSR